MLGATLAYGLFGEATFHFGEANFSVKMGPLSPPKTRRLFFFFFVLHLFFRGFSLFFFLEKGLFFIKMWQKFRKKDLILPIHGCFCSEGAPFVQCSVALTCRGHIFFVWGHFSHVGHFWSGRDGAHCQQGQHMIKKTLLEGNFFASAPAVLVSRHITIHECFWEPFWAVLNPYFSNIFVSGGISRHIRIQKCFWEPF